MNRREESLRRVERAGYAVGRAKRHAQTSSRDAEEAEYLLKAARAEMVEALAEYDLLANDDLDYDTLVRQAGA